MNDLGEIIINIKVIRTTKFNQIGGNLWERRIIMEIKEEKM